ncbi:MAG: hypothetical protein J1E57_07470 [Prevotella sp.]|nr:hypothetical protein [Prevotella sp.]
MTREEVRQLIEKYDEGLTSNAEERALRLFFKEQPQENIPEEWRVYKALFSFVEEESVNTATDDEMDNKVVNSSKRRSSKAVITRLTILAAAACIAITMIITTTQTAPTNNGNGKDYAVIDGKMVTDQHLIAAEAEAALQNVAYNDNDAFAAFDDL